MKIKNIILMVLIVVCITATLSPLQVKAVYYPDVKVDVQFREAPDNIADMVGNKLYIYLDYIDTDGNRREKLYVYDYVYDTVEFWFQNVAQTTIGIALLDGGGSSVKCSHYYYRNFNGDWKESSDRGYRLTYGINDVSSGTVMYNKANTLKILRETYTSSSVIPTPSATPSPTPFPVASVDIENTGITEVFSVALDFMRIPIAIAGFEVSMLEIMMFGFACTIVIYLVFAPVKK